MLRTLPIFPSSGFDQSTTTPVLLGVLLSWALTEWYGWVFAGLVVPGYLGAVFLLNPRSACIDVVEAVLTYAVARTLGEHLARTGLTSRLFGRERFFLVVLVSIVVRLATEGWLLPHVAPHATWAFSIGLVVVPLAANACWKTGLPRGVVQNGLPVLLVYLLLRFVFVPYTNLSLAGFELATENIGASFLTSPKVYILLVTGATLAAIANLRYGWDFNGILIPALLALVVLEPVKFVATFVEVFALLAATALVIRLTALARANIEGPRRTVLYFTVDYLLRYVFAIVVGKRLPGSDVVDLMGFGYLLPTLLAVKISQKGYAALVLLPTALVSLAAFVVGTLLGYTGFLLDLRPAAARDEVTRALPSPPSSAAGAALWVSTLTRSEPPSDAQTPPLPGATIAAAAEMAAASLPSGLPGSATTRILDVQHAGPDALLVRERFGDVQARVGDPAVLTRSPMGTAHRVVIYVPTPLAAPEAAAYAGQLLAEKKVDAVVLAGIEEPDGRARYESSGRTAARLIADKAGPGMVIALVAAGARPADSAEQKTSLTLHAANPAKRSELLAWAKRAAEQRAELGPVAASSEDDDARGPIDATLEVPASTMDLALAGPVEDLHPLSSAAAISLAMGDLAPARYRSEPEDLLALRRLVIEPLLASSDEGRSLARVRFAARVLGYRLLGPSELPSGEAGLALVPDKTARPLALVARASGVRQLVVEVANGDSAELRDLALRTASLAHADATLFDLNASARGSDGPAMRMAHAAATFPQPDRSSAVVLVRSARPEIDLGGGAQISAWGPREPAAPATTGAGAPESYGANRLLRELESAMSRAGLAATETPIDVQSRELAGRAILGSTPLAVLVADAAALRHASLDRARGAARLFDRLGIQSFDGDMADAARNLVLALPRDLPDGALDLPQTVERAAIEESVSAREHLGDAVARSATRALYVTAPDGDFLMAATRRGGEGVLLMAAAASPVPGSAEAALATRVPQANVAACAALLGQGGGTCLVREPASGNAP